MEVKPWKILFKVTHVPMAANEGIIALRASRLSILFATSIKLLVRATMTSPSEILEGLNV